MKRFAAPRPFLDVAPAAFPSNCRQAATIAARGLAPLVDDTYRRRAHCLVVAGQNVYIPERLHFLGAETGRDEIFHGCLIANCLLTRSTDGHVRQLAVRRISKHQEIWVIPFIVLLLGEYVIEIVHEIAGVLPALDRSAYADFVQQNRALMRILRSQAAGYWSTYHRGAYPDRRAYPGLAALYELETWAC